MSYRHDDPSIVSCFVSFNRARPAGFPRKRANCIGKGSVGTDGYKQYTPTGFNLFEKPCPRLWTNRGKIGKIIDNLNLIDMAAKGCIINV